MEIKSQSLAPLLSSSYPAYKKSSSLWGGGFEPPRIPSRGKLDFRNKNKNKNKNDNRIKSKRIYRWNTNKMQRNIRIQSNINKIQIKYKWNTDKMPIEIQMKSKIQLEYHMRIQMK